MSLSRFSLCGCIIAIAAALSSCSSGESPALKIAEEFNSLSAQIEKAAPDTKSLESIEEVNSKVGEEMETLMKENADYELTDDDRSALKKAMKNFLETSLKKSMEVAGQKTEGIEETVNTMMEMKVNPQIDAAKTLGDLGNATKL